MVGERDDNDDNNTSKKTLTMSYQWSQERQNEINIVLDMIESKHDDDFSIEEMMDMIENSHLLDPHHPSSNNSSSNNNNNQIISSSTDWMMDRVEIFSKNIDYAQSQVETLTTSIGTMASIAVDPNGGDRFVLDNDEDEEDDPFIQMTAFMQQRVATFVQNLGTLSGDTSR